MGEWRRGAVFGFGLACGFLVAVLFAMGAAYWYIKAQRAQAAATHADEVALFDKARAILTGWVLSEERDAITDGRTVLLIRWLGTEPRKALAFRCEPGSGKAPTVAAMFGISVERFGRSDTPVVYRLGSGAPVSQTWFTRRDIAFTDWKSEVDPVMSGIIGVDRITLRATAYDGTTVDLAVMTDGLAPKLEEFRKRCG